ncbi:MAG: hypothetical protein KGI33_02310 [Thaumarchaeota archaeon]|nr:hypothetical protein [Nitrososphaerota archaeon]
MKHRVRVDLAGGRTILLDLDDEICPITVRSFIEHLPLETNMNVWGDELYTDETTVSVGPENSKPVVSLMDVAYWPDGRAICLFFGPTPIGSVGEIRPYSPVNVMGKIIPTEKVLLKDIKGGTAAVFRLQQE